MLKKQSRRFDLSSISRRPGGAVEPELGIARVHARSGRRGVRRRLARGARPPAPARAAAAAGRGAAGARGTPHEPARRLSRYPHPAHATLHRRPAW